MAHLCETWPGYQTPAISLTQSQLLEAFQNTSGWKTYHFAFRQKSFKRDLSENHEQVLSTEDT